MLNRHLNQMKQFNKIVSHSGSIYLVNPFRSPKNNLPRKVSCLMKLKTEILEKRSIM